MNAWHVEPAKSFTVLVLRQPALHVHPSLIHPVEPQLGMGPVQRSALPSCLHTGGVQQG